MRACAPRSKARLVSKSDDRSLLTVPRHRELKQHLAQHIIRMLQGGEEQQSGLG